MRKTIIDLARENNEQIKQCAALLVEGFRVMAPDAWTTMAEALEEMDECLATHSGAPFKTKYTLLI